MLNSKFTADQEAGSKRKKLWPWVALLIVIFCAIYSYERVSAYLVENAEQLPLMFFDFIIEFFIGPGNDPHITDV